MADFKPIKNIGEYVDHLKGKGAKDVMATKGAPVIATKAQPGDTIEVWTKNGNLEVATETAHENQWLCTKADENGEVAIDANGHRNQWFQDDDKLRKNYQISDDFNGGLVQPKGGEKEFIQIDRDITIQVPWGENGALIPQNLQAGSYLNISNMDDVYGIAEEEFAETYNVTKEKSSSFSRELPEIDTPDNETTAEDTFGDIG